MRLRDTIALIQEFVYLLSLVLRVLAKSYLTVPYAPPKQKALRRGKAFCLFECRA
jgi:hypothetical protein